MAALGHNNPPPMNAAEDMAAVIFALSRAMRDSAAQQAVANRVGVTRQCINHYVTASRDMSLPRACQVARAAGYRLALVPVEG